MRDRRSSSGRSGRRQCGIGSSTSAPDCESRLPVGSSAKRTGRLVHERASDRDALLLGRREAPARACVSRWADQTEAIKLVDAAAGDPLTGEVERKVVVALTESVGSRLKDWKMKRCRPAQLLVSWVSFSAAGSRPRSRRLHFTVALVEGPRADRRRQAPEPDGPMIATASPRSTCMVTPRSASTAVSPTPTEQVEIVAADAGPTWRRGVSEHRCRRIVLLVSLVLDLHCAPVDQAAARHGAESFDGSRPSLRWIGSAPWSSWRSCRMAFFALPGDGRARLRGRRGKPSRAPGVPRRHRPPLSGGTC